jgi:uncharacterized protein YodC (DUF2158 family)
MTAQKFKIGTAVQHKSGGPKMAVKGYEGDEVVCEWFDKTKLMEKAFHQDVLEIYTPKHGVTRLLP